MTRWHPNLVSEPRTHRDHGVKYKRRQPWGGGMTHCHLQAKKIQKKLNLGDTWTMAVGFQNYPDTSLSCAAVSGTC